jgi:hypothetical protein
MPLSTTPAVIRRYLAFELQRLREAAPDPTTGKLPTPGKPQITQTAAGKHIGSESPQSVISKFENGQRLPRLGDVRLLMDLYGTPELYEHMRDLVNQARTTGPAFELDEMIDLPEGFDMYLGLEQGAERITTFETMAVTGILQCRPYALAAVRGHRRTVSAADIERSVDIRMRRQLALDRADQPLELVVILGEAALCQEIGGRAVLIQQLGYLLTAAERPNVDLRVLPYSASAHPALHGSFVVLDFPIERDPGVVYLEDLIGGRYRSDTNEIDEYRSVALRLLELSLSADDTTSMIHRVRKELIT